MRQNQKGFSLLEVALVLVLMGLLGALAVPSMKNIRRQEAKELANSLCLDLVAVKKLSRSNREATFELQLLRDTGTGKEYGYKIEAVGPDDDSWVRKEDKTSNRGKIQIDIEGTGASRAHKLVFKGGEVYKDTISSVNQYNKPLEMTISSDDVKVKIKFAYETGHYEITI